MLGFFSSTRRESTSGTRKVANRGLRFEGLEGRTLMSATPLALSLQEFGRDQASPAALVAEPLAMKTLDLPVGGIISGKISAPKEKDPYVFSGKKGEVVQLAVTRAEGDSRFSPYVKVFHEGRNGALTLVKEFKQGQDTQITLPKNGSYLVRVQDYNLTAHGTYKVGLEKINPASPSPITLVPGKIATQKIGESLEKDQFVFDGKKNEIVQLVATRTAGDSRFSPYVKVYEPGSGKPIAEFHIGKDMQITLPKDGKYLVQVQDDNLAQTGTYKVGLEKINPASPGPITLVPGKIATQKIEESLEKDQFVFDGKKNEIVQLVATRTAGDSRFSPYVRVYEPGSGKPIAEFHIGKDTQITLPRDGKYLVQVQDYDLTSRGTYKVGLEKINPASPGPITLVPGKIATQKIGESLEKDQLVFDGKKDEIVQLAVARTAGDSRFNPCVKVYEPGNGTPIAVFYMGNNRQIRLNKNGRYLVQVQDASLTWCGSYTVHLDKLTLPR